MSWQSERRDLAIWTAFGQHSAKRTERPLSCWAFSVRLRRRSQNSELAVDGDGRAAMPCLVLFCD